MSIHYSYIKRTTLDQFLKDNDLSIQVTEHLVGATSAFFSELLGCSQLKNKELYPITAQGASPSAAVDHIADLIRGNMFSKMTLVVPHNGKLKTIENPIYPEIQVEDPSWMKRKSWMS